MADSFNALFTHGAATARSPSGRTPVLLVSHEASRTGAPLTLLWLAEALRAMDRFDLRIVTRLGGPLVKDFARIAPVCNGPDHYTRLAVNPAVFATVIANGFAATEPRGLAVCNTACVAEYNEAFRRARVDVLTLLHELPMVIDSKTMDIVVRSSKYVGVYSEWNRARFKDDKAIPADKLLFTPPRLPHLASTVATPRQRRAARRAIGMPDDALIVLGAGYLHLIKGSDLFVQIAARCARALEPELRRRLVFCWIGDTETDLRLYFLHDVAALNLSGIVSLAGPQADPWPWYRAADLFACPSRCEALCLSVLEAMSVGLPVVAFSETGAAARFAAEAGGAIVPLIDIDAFSEAILAFLRDPGLRARVGEAGHRRVRQEFGDGALAPGLKAVFDGLAQPNRPSTQVSR